jgi:fatty aldehyde-generating acyl-ACP reductase
MARKHGFRLSGFRSFEREVTQQHIETVRRNARSARKPRNLHAAHT